MKRRSIKHFAKIISPKRCAMSKDNFDPWGPAKQAIIGAIQMVFLTAAALRRIWGGSTRRYRSPRADISAAAYQTIAHPILFGFVVFSISAVGNRVLA